MEFDQKVFERLKGVLIKYEVQILEREKNFIKLKLNQQIVISIGYNKRENSYILFLGNTYSNAIEIDNYMLKEFFNSDLKLSEVPQEVFINNAYSFIENQVQDMLTNGNMDELEKYNLERSKKYTNNLGSR